MSEDVLGKGQDGRVDDPRVLLAEDVGPEHLEVVLPLAGADVLRLFYRQVLLKTVCIPKVLRSPHQTQSPEELHFSPRVHMAGKGDG